MTVPNLSTVEFAHSLHELFSNPLPEEASEIAREMLINVIANTIWGSGDPSLQPLLKLLGLDAHNPRATIFGITRNSDATKKALAIAFGCRMGNLNSFDPRTLSGSTEAVFGAALAVAQQETVDGLSFLKSFAIGCEVHMRLSRVFVSENYQTQNGIYVPTVVGPVSAAIAAGLLANLNPELLASAIGLAASQTLGNRSNMGTLVEPFTVGKAAYNGVLSVSMSKNGFTAPPDVFENPRGFFAVLGSPNMNLEPVFAHLGDRWVIRETKFKDYPCSHHLLGLADHILLPINNRYTVEDIDVIKVTVGPEFPSEVLNSQCSSTFEAKSSLTYTIAVGLMDRCIGPEQYTLETLQSADLSAFRDKILTLIDSNMPSDQCVLTITRSDGQSITHTISSRSVDDSLPRNKDDHLTLATNLIDKGLPGATQKILASVNNLDDSSLSLVALSQSLI